MSLEQPGWPYGFGDASSATTPPAASASGAAPAPAPAAAPATPLSPPPGVNWTFVVVSGVVVSVLSTLVWEGLKKTGTEVKKANRKMKHSHR